VNELIDEVLLETAIENTAARAFWAEYFCYPELEEIVAWKYFHAALADVSGIEKHEFEIFFKYLTNSDQNVSLDSFNLFVNWFGSDFFSPQTCRDALTQIQKLISRPWFHGLIEQSEANARLAIHPEGTYLVRLSKTHMEYPFTLSINLFGNKPQHVRIRKSEAGDDILYSVAGHKGAYKLLVDLLEAIIDPFNLKNACPNITSVSAYE